MPPPEVVPQWATALTAKVDDIAFQLSEVQAAIEDLGAPDLVPNLAMVIQALGSVPDSWRSLPAVADAITETVKAAARKVKAVVEDSG